MSKLTITLVAACDRNGAIGKGNTLPWKHRADMQMFKKLTTGGTVVMGSKTYLSMGAKPLPNRTNVVLTRYPDKFVQVEGVHFVNLMDADSEQTRLEQLSRFTVNDNLIVIGGEQVYIQFLPMADVIALSRLDLEVEGADAFFPDFYSGVRKDLWEQVCIDHPASGDDVAWQQCLYRRK